jgi:hypothetical protein
MIRVELYKVELRRRKLYKRNQKKDVDFKVSNEILHDRRNIDDKNNKEKPDNSQFSYFSRVMEIRSHNFQLELALQLKVQILFW